MAVIAIACQWPAFPESPFPAALNVAVAVTFTLAGLLLIGEEALGSVAAAFVLSGLLWAAAWSVSWDAGPSAVVSSFGYTHFWICLAWGVLRFPNGRVQTTTERVILGSGVLIVPVANLVLIGISRPEKFGYDPNVWWYGSPINTTVFDTIVHVLDALTLVVVVAFTAVIHRRLRRSSPMERRMLGPSTFALLAAFLIAAVANAFTYFPRTAELDMVTVPMALALLAVPVAFAGAAVRRQLARARIAQLLSTLATPPTVPAVRDVLRAALGDDSAEIYLWIPEENRHVDSSGQPAEPPEPDENVLVAPVHTTTGEPLAVVSADSALERDRDLVDVALHASAIALENARLHAKVAAQLEAVRASRTRILEASLAERRRLERDLHDGAQQRLLALATRLGLARAQASDPATIATIEAAKNDLQAALQELRSLARGIHPAVLSQGGLRPALDVVVESLPIEVDLDVPEDRFDAALETTAYYTVCEALTNTVKHAGATRARVRVRLTDDQLFIEVSDDGQGGASVQENGGLAGLDDRVRALGGELSVDSPQGGGTRLTASIPCA